jgi:hypothetical protein
MGVPGNVRQKQIEFGGKRRSHRRSAITQRRQRADRASELKDQISPTVTGGACCSHVRRQAQWTCAFVSVA